MSIATGTTLGGYPWRERNSSISDGFQGRLIGPKVLVPSVSAGGPEADPLPSTASRTLG